MAFKNERVKNYKRNAEILILLSQKMNTWKTNIFLFPPMNLNIPIY